jgi:hypothetical protein
MNTVAVGYALVGLAVPMILGGTVRGRLLAWAAMVPAVILGGIGFVLFLKLNELLAGVG